ncbi:hypothetical protein ES332_A06G190600v1 [Gossypium tomentosum]|uniref:Uncharacterized protein n=1 Tax=Gossypium tomentosum TaxID=34277 RepID=A0A5D2Q989_GOSTO|nr:hypothetical protein ES332_A06G190600v1 [Gossypium tomentosum]
MPFWCKVEGKVGPWASCMPRAHMGRVQRQGRRLGFRFAKIGLILGLSGCPCNWVLVYISFLGLG